MREILFRAKRIDNGEWVEGFLFLISCDGINFWCIGNEPLSANDYSEIRGEHVDWFCVDEETICQYTGMQDKNGKKIWENDIVSINTYSWEEPEEDYFGKIIYSEGWACWCIQQPDDEKPIPLCECEGSYQTDRFVEGNVFDNPELLKGDQSCTDL